MLIGLAISPFRARRKLAAGGAPTYTRTAFVNTAATPSTGVLNDPAFPFSSFYDAVDALAVNYGYQPTTIRLMSDANGDANASNMDTLLFSGAGLTIQSHDATVRTLYGTTSFGSNYNSELHLSKVTIAELVKSPHGSASIESAGTITGDSQTTIALLLCNSSSDTAATGTPGSTTGNLTGATGTAGTNGDPSGTPAPTVGGPGESVDASGGAGGPGDNGFGAWNITLLGSGVCGSASLSSSSPGGDGGGGGYGNLAVGGTGGSGGDSTAIVFQNGADGGTGGNATSNGGNGGPAGNGGRGGNIYRSAGWTIASSSLTGYAPGEPGEYGYFGGTITAGSGGSGGDGAIGGSAGATGAAGTAYAGNNGSTGATGLNGASGSIINL